MALALWIIGGVVAWSVCVALVATFWQAYDDLPFNRPVRIVLLLFAPFTIIGAFMLGAISGVLHAVWDAIR